MNMSSRARSRVVLKKKKKPIGRAVATNEKSHPMKNHLAIKIKTTTGEEKEKRERMYVYVHIELVTSSGKCPLFFFLKFYVCVKANLKVMILLITVRDHLAQVFTRVDDFSFTSAQKYSDI